MNMFLVLLFPSERELAKSFDVSRSLVRSAIEQLCTEGILKKNIMERELTLC